MINSTFGYQNQNSWLSRLNPIAKTALIGTIICFFVAHPGDYKKTFFALLTFSAFALINGIKINNFIKATFLLRFLIAIVFFFQVLINHHEIMKAFDVIGRILGVTFCAVCYVITTSQSEMLYFWECVFYPLRFVKFPTREWALSMVTAIRFFPTIFDEINRISEAQISRGVHPKNKSLLKSKSEWLALIIPTIMISIKRSKEIAQAMEIRGYSRTNTPTKYKVYQLNLLDFFIVLLIINTIVLTFLP